MKFSILINQKAILSLVEENFDLIDAAILDFLIDFCSSDNKKIERMSYREQGIEYYYTWVNQELVNKELPLLRFKQTDSISKRIQKIKKYGFIKVFTVRAPESGGLRTYIRLTEKIDLLKFDNNLSNQITTPLSVSTDRPISLNLKTYQFKLKNNNTNDNNTNDNICSLTNSIFTYYKEKINKDVKLTEQAKEKIKIRLKIYSKEELLRAIDKFSKNQWRMENNADNPLTWFFRSDEQIEKFLLLKPEKKIGLTVI